MSIQTVSFVDPQNSGRQLDQTLKGFFDQPHPDWRGEGGKMPHKLAYGVHGLETRVGEAELKSVDHELIAGLHPEKGGSTFLAAKVNQAKEVLLDR